MFHFMLGQFGLGILAGVGGTLLAKKYGKDKDLGKGVEAALTKAASKLGVKVERQKATTGKSSGISEATA